MSEYYQATMTTNGQITIPKSLREFLNIHPGQSVTFKKDRDSISIERNFSAREAFEAIQKIPLSQKTLEAIERNRGKTVRELREEFESSEEGKAYVRKMYGL